MGSALANLTSAIRSFVLGVRVLRPGVVTTVLGVVLLSLHASASAQVDPFSQDDGKLSDPERLLGRGLYEQAIKVASEQQVALGAFGINESLPIVIAKSQMALGRYEEALATIDAGLERYENSIRIRWVGSKVAAYNDQVQRSLTLLSEIETLAKRSAWRFRDTPNQLILGKYYLSRNADAKQVLKSFFQPALKRNASDPAVYRAIGQLSLDKGDYAMAAENFKRLVKILPEDSDAHFRLAQCFVRSNGEKATENLNRALELNPRHADALLFVVDQKMNSENYDEAQATIDKVLALNPDHPEALAYRATIAHLENDFEMEFEFRKQALGHWRGNPNVDHVIGRELSEKYRFAEGQKYQRRALVFDESFLPAKVQLAHDLLRLGQEVEGWKLADEVFDRDQYSVLAHNLLMLRDEMASFKTLSQDGFLVRMSPREAAIYGDRVLELLDRASKRLTKKYQVELETPIVIEIFPRQRDFAIRTFGLPGGAGFLGVCFGRVITMNSPAAQGASLTSWESVLWHEFCHVVTLQKTRNKMPRWLSEGISVYEEKLADPAWGESMSRRYHDMLLKELTPVSQLSGAFMRPPSPVHLQFAYYESSLVVKYIVDTHGLPSLVNVLDELAIGTPINRALEKHIEPIDSLDKKFKAYATGLANAFAPKADWATPDVIPPNADAEFWNAWNKEHPNSIVGLVEEASQLIQREQFIDALALLTTANELCPEEPSPYPVMAAAYRGLEYTNKEFETLERFAKIEASDSKLYLRLLELASERKDWVAMREYANRLAAVNPLIKSSHEYLATAAEKTNDKQSSVQALQVLAEMNPLDIADIRYRLATAYFDLDDLPNAKRQVLTALEQAPRYRDAHQLLRKIVAKEKTLEGSEIEPKSNPKESK